MALTRKALKAMGLSEEQIDSVIEAHTETIEGLKTQITTLKAEAEKVPALEKQIRDADSDGFKTKYEAEKSAHEKTRSEYAAKEAAALAKGLFKSELEALGITGTRADKIVKATDLTAYAIKDGAYEDAEAVRSAIKTDWAEFIPTTTTRGAQVETPPANTGGRYKTRAEIMQIKDTSERQRAIAQNLDLFQQKG